MIVVMQQGASAAEIEEVEERLREMGFQTHPIYGVERTVIGAIGDKRDSHYEVILNIPGVERVITNWWRGRSSLKPAQFTLGKLLSAPMKSWWWPDRALSRAKFSS